MKKIHFILFFISLITIATACNKRDAIEYNNAIIASQSNIDDACKRYIAIILEADSLGEYSRIKAETDSLYTIINAEIENVKNLEVPKNGQRLKESAIIIFEYYKKIPEIGIKAAGFTKETSVADYNSFIREFNNAVDEGAKLETDLVKEQNQFMEANDIKIK